MTVGELRAGQTVVALGAAGGVGSAVVDIAHRTGARVVAVTSGAARARFVRELGADVVIDRTTEPLRERLQQALPEGAEVVVDPVGGTLSEVVLRRMAWMTGPLFGACIYGVMHFVIVPLSHATTKSPSRSIAMLGSACNPVVGKATRCSLRTPLRTSSRVAAMAMPE